MELKNYSLRDLILIGIRSEIEAKETYSKTAQAVKNPFLKSRLESLAEDEELHRDILEKMYKRLYPDEEMKVPENPDFLPENPDIKILKEINGVADVRLILEQAMQSELSAKRYYEDIAEMIEDPYLKKMMLYMAKVEEGHYEILNREFKEIEEFESIMSDMDYTQFDARF
ncbi:MAG: ferritin family protein [Euryarchaeota archaeon]|nr:ferritin family protein [Euryarchaeota archaeon]